MRVQCGYSLFTTTQRGPHGLGLSRQGWDGAAGSGGASPEHGDPNHPLLDKQNGNSMRVHQRPHPYKRGCIPVRGTSLSRAWGSPAPGPTVHPQRPHSPGTCLAWEARGLPAPPRVLPRAQPVGSHAGPSLVGSGCSRQPHWASEERQIRQLWGPRGLGEQEALTRPLGCSTPGLQKHARLPTADHGTCRPNTTRSRWEPAGTGPRNQFQTFCLERGLGGGPPTWPACPRKPTSTPRVGMGLLVGGGLAERAGGQDSAATGRLPADATRISQMPLENQLQHLYPWCGLCWGFRPS